jgi:hypothetical protein
MHKNAEELTWMGMRRGITVQMWAIMVGKSSILAMKYCSSFSGHLALGRLHATYTSAGSSMEKNLVFCECKMHC